MGNPKQKWTAEEEQALLNGVAKHGPGKWTIILLDPEFAPFLNQRTNINLKDKWRNLRLGNSGEGSRDKSRVADKVKPLNFTVTPSSNPNAQNSSPADDVDVLIDDLSINERDGNNAQRYNEMIFEALSTIKDKNGCDLSAILHFIEQRHKVPQKFRSILGTRLSRLVSQGKLKKEENSFRISEDAVLGPRTSPRKQKQKELKPISRKKLEEAAVSVAYKVAEAENKSYLADEAVKEAERVSEIAENTYQILQLVKEIHEQCEIFLLA